MIRNRYSDLKCVHTELLYRWNLEAIIDQLEIDDDYRLLSPLVHFKWLIKLRKAITFSRIESSAIICLSISSWVQKCTEDKMNALFGAANRLFEVILQRAYKLQKHTDLLGWNKLVDDLFLIMHRLSFYEDDYVNYLLTNAKRTLCFLSNQRVEVIVCSLFQNWKFGYINGNIH